MDPSEAIPVLMDFAGIPDAATARRFLEQARGDINAAASLYMDSVAVNDQISASSVNGDGLRAPDPEYSQTLLSPSFHSAQVAASSAGFPQRNVTALAVNSSAGTVAFRELFELPGGLSCQDSFARARELGRAQNKWLLVNIQQVDAFESLRLNRDVWKAEVVQDLIKDFFIFWQRTDQCEEGQIFCDMYRVTSLPHVCAIDPLTGRCLKSWSTRVLSDAVAVQSEFFEFVERQQMAELKKTPTQKPSEDSKGAPLQPTLAPAGPADAAVRSGAAPSEASVANASSPVGAAASAAVVAASTTNGVDKTTEGHQLQSHKPSTEEAEPSAYKDVNSQLLDLMRLREQRRQQQRKTPTQG